MTIPFIVSIYVLFYVCSFNLANCSACLLNGTNTIFVQIITSAVLAFSYLFVIFVWGKQMKMTGIICLMGICYVIMGIVYSYQSYLIIERKATGIWSR